WTPTGSVSPAPCAWSAVPPPEPRIFLPEDWHTALPRFHTEITTRLNPPRRHRTCPRKIKRGQHNDYHKKKPHRPEPASTRHPGPATIRFHPLTTAA
ncbi:hypothetical protein MXD63_25940, partial [Frankia sp. Cpl3]|nr:hypothetical protein [Frankia sp. Cpl3]